MIRTILAALAAATISGGAWAQALVPGCPLPGSIPCVATQVFTPQAETTLAVTAVSGRVAFPATGSLNLMVTNTGTKTAYYVAGNVSAVATTSSLPIDAGKTVVLSQGNNTYLAAITGGSDTTSLTLRSGTGQPVLVYGDITGTLTGTVTGTLTPGTVTIVPLAVSSVTTGGTAVTALAAGGASAGGFLVTANAAGICVDQTTTAGTVTGTPSTTVCVAQNVPYFLTPNGHAVSVNSSSSSVAFAGQGNN